MTDKLTRAVEAVLSEIEQHTDLWAVDVARQLRALLAEARPEEPGLPVQDRPMWFAYDEDEGFAFFSTAESARIEAGNRLDVYRDDAAEGWADEVDSVRWGRVYQEARETVCITREEWEKTHDPEEEPCPGGEGTDGYSDYGMMPALAARPAEDGLREALEHCRDHAHYGPETARIIDAALGDRPAKEGERGKP